MEQDQNLFSLSIEPITKSHLMDTSRWARFIAIAGMVLLVLALVFAFLVATIWSDQQYIWLSIYGREAGELTPGMRITYLLFTIVILAIFFFPLLFLLQFSNKIRTALVANQQESLNAAFQSLKKLFRFVGIVLLIIVAVYALIFVLAIMAAGTE